MGTHYSVIIMLNVMIMTLKAGYQTVFGYQIDDTLCLTGDFNHTTVEFTSSGRSWLVGGVNSAAVAAGGGTFAATFDVVVNCRLSHFREPKNPLLPTIHKKLIPPPVRLKLWTISDSYNLAILLEVQQSLNDNFDKYS